MSNRTDSWERKVEILRNTKPSRRRKRALVQMNMSGNEWQRMRVALGDLPEKALRSLNAPPARLDNPLGAG